LEAKKEERRKKLSKKNTKDSNETSDKLPSIDAHRNSGDSNKLPEDNEIIDNDEL